MPIEPGFDLIDLQPRERNLAQTGDEMQPDGLLIRQPGARPEAALFVVEPPQEEVFDRLPFIRHDVALLHRAQEALQFSRDLAARRTVDAFAAPLAVLPSQIHLGHPLPVRPLRDGAFPATSSSCHSLPPAERVARPSRARHPTATRPFSSAILDKRPRASASAADVLLNPGAELRRRHTHARTHAHRWQHTGRNQFVHLRPTDARGARRLRRDVREVCPCPSAAFLAEHPRRIGEHDTKAIGLIHRRIPFCCCDRRSSSAVLSACRASSRVQGSW